MQRDGRNGFDDRRSAISTVARRTTETGRKPNGSFTSLGGNRGRFPSEVARLDRFQPFGMAAMRRTGVI